jgi:GT2 family glycosyltransferase
MPKISIITVSYNTKNDLDNCLNSLKPALNGISSEVIIVDNASTDGSLQMVKNDHPWVKLIKLKENLGFGKANNKGASVATGDYLLFLNPDTLLNTNTVKDSLKLAQKIPNLGAFTCRLLYADGSIQPSGGYFPTLFRLFAWHTALDEIPFLNFLIKPIHPAPYFYKKSFSPDWITGAFFLTPRKVFVDVQGFDPNIFMYGEELELCYRLKQLGKTIYYSDTPTLTHLQAKSSSSRFATLSEIKGLKYFFNKHKPKSQQLAANLLFKLGSLLRLTFFGIMLGNEEKRKTYSDALKK